MIHNHVHLLLGKFAITTAFLCKHCPTSQVWHVSQAPDHHSRRWRDLKPIHSARKHFKQYTAGKRWKMTTRCDNSNSCILKQSSRRRLPLAARLIATWHDSFERLRIPVDVTNVLMPKCLIDSCRLCILVRVLLNFLFHHLDKILGEMLPLETSFRFCTQHKLLVKLLRAAFSP